MNWFTKHADAITVIGAIIASMLWMNGKFNEVESRFNQVDRRFAEVEKEIAVMKTVMIMRNVMPSELASKEVEK